MAVLTLSLRGTGNCSRSVCARTTSIILSAMLLLILTCPTRAVLTNKGIGKCPHIVKQKEVISLHCDRICDKEVWTEESCLSSWLLFSSGYE